VIYPSLPLGVPVAQAAATPAELARVGSFPMYTLGAIPDGLRYGGSLLVRRPTGQPSGGWIFFQSYDAALAMWQTTVRIRAKRHFPRPYPLWFSAAMGPSGPAVIPEKVTFLPSPGIMVATALGYVFHWIQSDTLYTLFAEHGPTHEQAEAIGRSLRLPD
jgi:hypothetical protein